MPAALARGYLGDALVVVPADAGRRAFPSAGTGWEAEVLAGRAFVLESSAAGRLPTHVDWRDWFCLSGFDWVGSAVVSFRFRFETCGFFFFPLARADMSL